MEVTGPGSVQGSVPIQPVRGSAEVSSPEGVRPAAVQDEVDISPAGKLLSDLGQISEVRAERLAQIKAAIEAGEYETPEKLQIALERLLGEIRSELEADGRG